MAEGYHRMGGPADKVPPVLVVYMQPGSLWRGLAHGEKLVDMGDIAVMEHTSKGMECYLFAAERRMMFPYPPNEQVALDHHNHIRIGDREGNVKVTFAPAGE